MQYKCLKTNKKQMQHISTASGQDGGESDLGLFYSQYRPAM